MAEGRGLGTGGSKGQADARGGFANTRTELEEAEPQRGEVGLAQMVRRGDGVTQGKHQPVGGSGEFRKGSLRSSLMSKTKAHGRHKRRGHSAKKD